MKDDPGAHAVFTEQGSSAYTRIKMDDAPKLLKIPRSECPDIWIRLLLTDHHHKHHVSLASGLTVLS